MSEETHNEGSEEEKDPIGDSHDEDFGLPDLEFEELQELDLNMDDDASDEGEAAGDGGQEVLQGSDDIDMSVLDDIEVPEPEETSEPVAEVETPESTDQAAAVLDEGIDEVEDILDSAQLISDRLGDEEEDPLKPDFSSDINYDDLIGAVAGDDPASSDLSIEDSASGEEEVMGLTDDEIAALETMDLEDATGETDTSDDLLAGINSPDELAALGIDEEAGEPSLEESSDSESMFSADIAEDPFAATEEESGEEAAFSGESEGSIFESDEISLQEEEKIDFEPPEEPSLPPNYKPYTYEEATSGNFTKVIVIGAVSFVLVGFVLLYFFKGSAGEGEGKEVAKTENVQKKPAAKKPAAKKPAAKKPAAKSSNTNSKSNTNKPASTASNTSSRKPANNRSNRTQRRAQPAQSANAGEIVQVTDRRGRSYVIVGSFIDEDLAMDYAKELSAKGNGVKIIHPYGTSKRYRVSIADFGTYQDAAGQLTTYKSAFGDQVWALKY